ncbi:MAG: hypothetical protein Ct9H300mP25_12930 [Acidobacteriota bacterium]|nr:MAG: hypothetical protein Ct9H300mP25_12930 [Acidobacteriota bacterium]
MASRLIVRDAFFLRSMGKRQISRISADGSREVVVDNHEGNRLNSPNDLVFHSDGSLYFTDPPYGLAAQDDDPAKEVAVNGIYRLSADGELSLLADQTRPNGIGLSPDESVSMLQTLTTRAKFGWCTTFGFPRHADQWTRICRCYG